MTMSWSSFILWWKYFFVMPASIAPLIKWFHCIKQIIFETHPPPTQEGEWCLKVPFIENYGDIEIFKLIVGGEVRAGEVFFQKSFNFWLHPLMIISKSIFNSLPSRINPTCFLISSLSCRKYIYFYAMLIVK